MGMITTADDLFGPTLPGIDRTLTPPEHVVVRFWEPFHQHGMPTHSTDLVAKAVVDAGRWIVNCPSCRSAQYASKSDRRYFCTDCENGWVPVEWPDNVEEIEATLARIGDPKARNWSPE